MKELSVKTQIKKLKWDKPSFEVLDAIQYRKKNYNYFYIVDYKRISDTQLLMNVYKSGKDFQKIYQSRTLFDKEQVAFATEYIDENDKVKYSSCVKIDYWITSFVTSNIKIARDFFSLDYDPGSDRIYFDFVDQCKEKTIKKRHEKERKKIDEAMSLVKPEPNGVQDFLKNLPMKYMVYKKNSGHCGWCDKDIVLPEKHERHNAYGKCPVCKKKVQFKAQGTMARVCREQKFGVVVQRYNSESLIFRYYEVVQLYNKDKAAYTYSICENVRSIQNIKTGERKNYQYAFFYKDSFRSWCNVNNFFHSYYGYIESYKVNFSGEGSIFRRGLKTTLKNAGYTHTGLIELLPYAIEQELYSTEYEKMFKNVVNDNNITEKLVKTGFKELALKHSLGYVHNYGTNGGRIELNKEGKTICEILKISKQVYRSLTSELRESLTGNMLSILQKDVPINLEDLHFFGNVSGIEASDLKMMTEYTTCHKIRRYLTKLAEQDTSTKMISLARLYKDYLHMVSGPHIGLDGEIYLNDMKNTMILFPKNLHEAHDREVINLHETKNELARRKKEESIKKLNTILADIKKKYNFTDEQETLAIVAPKNGQEIVQEGEKQHICVGVAGYIEDMAEGKTCILFLRKKEALSKPYYTVEVKDGSICQVRGYGNKSPEEDVISFMERYAKAKNLRVAY